MRVQEKCLPCIVNQAIKVADMTGLKDKEILLNKVFSYLGTVEYKKLTTPELIGEIFKILKEETGNLDPYFETRNKYNKLFLGRLESIENEIDTSEFPFETAIKYAIIGNIIDFNPIHDLTIQDIDEIMTMNKEKELEVNHTGKLIKDLKKAKSVLYLGDNCGEICFDKLLVKKMKKINPACQFYFGTRGENVVNDSVEEDAYFVGMDEYAKIISNGDCSLGTVLYRTSEEFHSIYEQADVVIAKGQANYESLSEEYKNIYFLLMTKCGVIAKNIGVEEQKMICLNLLEN